MTNNLIKSYRNMLLSEKNEIKLGDLGISKLMNNTHASTHAGTPLYMSPEVFKAQFMVTKYYPNTDVW
jgi:serine/threonine protein kinase